MSAPNSRKRTAPGASPTVPVQHNIPQQFTTDSVSDAMTRWNGAPDPSAFLDNNSYAANPYLMAPNAAQFQPPVPGPSNAVARRQMNQALQQTSQRSAYDATTDPWASFGENEGALIQQPNGEHAAEEDSVEKLEELAAHAKREAQVKRKQIPPFVQKLSSFLEERKNEDLIRWSEKGDSFIVLDEDEFAKTLIPELFKHNNYASFVRQLNMYGFHKCVGLSDNSMRASERKNKSPSEYSNPYFRRGHPNLLWLINKPRGKKEATTKNSAGGRVDSDDEAANEEATGHPGPSNVNAQASRSLPSTESAQPPKKEISLIRDELQKVREQQKLILGAINSLQRNNHELYNQALMFQSQHDRHQNSINAILNFLANVFRKTLEDQSGTQNVSDIISSMLTNQGQQGHGSVVDLGDFFQTQMDASGGLGGPMGKRARGLLPPIPGQQAPPQQSRSTSGSNYQSASIHNPEMGHVTELLDNDTPPSLRQELENNPQERMMKIINDHNATSNPTALDPGAAELVANAPNTLNNDQRSQLVNFMAGQSSPSSTTPGSSAPPPSRSRTQQPPSASTTPQPHVNSRPSPPSLSPIMRSPVMPAPSLSHISANKEELDRLQRLQNDQDTKISELGELLGPLSPSGRIPGLDGADGFFDAPNVDLDQYFNSDAFLHDGNFGDAGDFNFNLDPDAAAAAAAVAEAAGLQNTDETPSPTGTEEIQRDDMTSPSRGSKRQRTT